MADRFFTPDALRPGEVQLTGPEAHHLAAVRRIGVGEHVTLFNGDGREYPAEVLGVGKRAVSLLVSDPVAVDRERTPALWVAAALPKGDRLDFLVEKLTELGVARFVPLVTERSVVRPKADAVEKYQRMVIEASKQCGRNVLMAVEPPAPWASFAARPDLPPRRLILHPGGTEELAGTTEAAVVAVGPEGGFTDAEAATPGWTPTRLGPMILRIETAAIAAAVTCAASPGRAPRA